MNTLQFYQNQVAEKRGYATFLHLFWEETYDAIDAAFKEAATLYAEEACKEQKRIDADAATLVTDYKGNKSFPDKFICSSLETIEVCTDSILNAPLAVNTEKE